MSMLHQWSKLMKGGEKIDIKNYHRNNGIDNSLAFICE